MIHLLMIMMASRIDMTATENNNVWIKFSVVEVMLRQNKDANSYDDDDDDDNGVLRDIIVKFDADGDVPVCLNKQHQVIVMLWLV